MIKRIVHIVLSVWLAILLLFGTTPKEFVHLFANHTDTIEHYHHHGFEISKQHHHCQFLSLHLMPFAHDIVLPRLFFQKPVFDIPQVCFIANFMGCTHINLPARAPPVS